MEARLDLITLGRELARLLAEGLPETTEIQLSIGGKLYAVAGVDFEGSLDGSRSVLKFKGIDPEHLHIWVPQGASSSHMPDHYKCQVCGETVKTLSEMH